MFLLTVFAKNEKANLSNRGPDGVDRHCEGASRRLQERPMTKAFDKIMAGLDDARAYPAW